MFKFFRKPAKPQFSVSFEEAMAGIEASIYSAQQEVAALERQYDDALQFEAARHIKRLLISTERSMAGALILESMTAKFVEKDLLHYATATSMAMRMVSASKVASLIDPAKWIEYASSLAFLEGGVAGFVTRAGVEVWPVRYYEQERFEEYRRSVMEGAATGDQV